MSGFKRQIKRAQEREARGSGFSNGKKLKLAMRKNGPFPIPGQSFPNAARRYVRHLYQVSDIRMASLRGHRPPPAGLSDRAPAGESE